MGRRRRRVIRIVKKKLPTVFICPRCGEEAVRVTIAKDTGHATVLCALCNLKDEFPAHPAAQAIDVYSYFTDRFYGVKEPRAIIPHEREFEHPPSEEGPSEEEAEAQPPEPGMAPEPSLREGVPEKPELEAEQPLTEDVSRPEPSEQAAPELGPARPSQQTTTQDAQSETPAETTTEAEKESEEEREPFADILENKDKKRYSSTPVPQQSSEQTS
ncbi:MAG TPA: transcription elongation factor 1 family protein [Candidatus Bathyarchaeia archaeon]